MINLYYETELGKLYNGDSLKVMKSFPDNYFSTIITDPPYGLFFMGKNWDKGIPGIPFWKEALRICKPGTFLFAFGGTRTHHRLMCFIEDAGWEIRDCAMWLYGSGFPKSHNISKAIDKAKGRKREIIEKIRIKGGGTEHINRGNLDQEFRPGDYQKGENVLDITIPASKEAEFWEMSSQLRIKAVPR